MCLHYVILPDTSANLWEQNAYKAPGFSFFVPGSPVMRFLLINVFDFLAISLFLYFLASFRDHRRRGGLSYPPGPPSWPIVGNLLDVPKDAPWSAYAEMSKKYGKRDILGTPP